MVNIAQINGKIIDEAHILHTEFRGCPVFDCNLIADFACLFQRLELNNKIITDHGYNQIGNIDIGTKLKCVITAICSTRYRAISCAGLIHPNRAPTFTRSLPCSYLSCVLVRFLNCLKSRFINGIFAITAIEDINIITTASF